MANIQSAIQFGNREVLVTVAASQFGGHIAHQFEQGTIGVNPYADRDDGRKHPDRLLLAGRRAVMKGHADDDFFCTTDA